MVKLVIKAKVTYNQKFMPMRFELDPYSIMPLYVL